MKRITLSKLDFLLKAIGVIFLIIGIVAAVMGPMEIYCFYLFGSGGSFHYLGFGFGSLMFANVAVQIAGYYLIAAVFIPLGYAHLTLRRWARTLVEALLWCWMVVGVPLVVFFVLVLVQAKPLSAGVLPLLGLACVLLYPIAPAGLLYFYRRADVRVAFDSHDTIRSWLEKIPLSILVHGILLTFFVLVHHLPVLFNGLIPFFGTFLVAVDGFTATAFVILGLVLLSAGVFARKMWAWWGSIVYLVFMGVSSILTLSKVNFQEMIRMVNFPASEYTALQNVPIESVHMLIMIQMPMLLALIVFIRSRRDFSTNTDRS
jgi:hypothetical protein